MRIISMVAGVCLAATAFSGQVAWETRRLRTSDAAKAGGYPGWTVRVTDAEEGAAVTVTEDGGSSRGVICIGTRVRPDAETVLTLAGAYLTHCGLEHRSGDLMLAVWSAEAWDALTDDPQTEHIDGADGVPRPLWGARIHSMTVPEPEAPVPFPERVQLGLASVLRMHAGESLVLGLKWMGAHTSVETATFSGLRLETREPRDPMAELFEVINADLPELAAVGAAVERGDRAAAIDALLVHLRQRFPLPEPTTLNDAALHEANMAAEKRFRSIGSDRFYHLGTEFDWHRNAIDDKEWLLHLHWHRILRTTAQAGRATGDARYTAAVAAILRDWMAKNFPGATWSWRTLEVSLRAMLWPQVYPYLLHSDVFSREDHARFLCSWAAHLDSLLPEERFHSGHNFGATECKALLTVGLTMPEFRDAAHWVEVGWQRLEGEMQTQVLPDGAQVELTMGYHNGVTNTFYSMAKLAQTHGLEPSAAYWDRLEKMHEYTLFLTMPDGAQPSLGDTWGSRQAKLVRRGAEVFGREDMRFVAGNGREGMRPDCLDSVLPSAGYYVMRTAWTDDPDGIYLLFDAAHHWGGWHQHYDALGVVLYAHGRTLLPDAGPFAYGSPLRATFKGTPSHSTVSVDGEDQGTEPCTLHAFATGDGLSVADASHAGYEGVEHRRQVVFVRPAGDLPGYAVIVDRVQGEGSHALSCRYHLPPGNAVPTHGGRGARTDVSEGGNLLVLSLSHAADAVQIGTSWITARYNQKEDRPFVGIASEGVLPALFVTLLFPYDGLPGDLPTAALEGRPDAMGALEVVVTGPGWQDRLSVSEPVAGGRGLQAEPGDVATVLRIRR